MTGREFEAVYAAARRSRHHSVVVVASRYRCREHTDQPVTVRGTGCPECARNAPPETKQRVPRVSVGKHAVAEYVNAAIRHADNEQDRP